VLGLIDQLLMIGAIEEPPSPRFSIASRTQRN